MPDPTALPDVFRLTCPTCGLAVLVDSLDRWGCSACRGPVAVEPLDHPAFRRLFAIVRRHFGADELADTQQGLVFLYRETDAPFERLREELEAVGFLPFVRPYGAARMCRIVGRPRRKPMLLPRHLLLFALTCFTTVWVGYDYGVRMVTAGQASSAVWVAVAYAAALFVILGGHEMGHFLIARRTGTEASLPYFIPGPPPIGTFGALISLRTPAPDRDAAVLLGAAGPIVGFLLCIPVLWYGLALSPVPGVSAVPGMRVFVLGQPLLLRLLGAAPDLTTLTIHPVAFAGCIGLVATTFNLLPIGQLDGGQIARALLGEKGHRTFSYVVVGALMLLSVFWGGWLWWALLGLVVTLLGHPGALDEVKPMTWKSVAATIAVVAVFALSFALAPFVALR